MSYKKTQKGSSMTWESIQHTGKGEKYSQIRKFQYCNKLMY